MKRKSLPFKSLLLFLLMAFQCITPALAASVPPPEKAPRGEWRYEYDDPYIYKFEEREAGGQPRDGYVFHSPGYISWSPGGTSVSSTISLAGGKKSL